nr:reverse transcriptase domain-containing protein [Tanacetum cinerariifolium]
MADFVLWKSFSKHPRKGTYNHVAPQNRASNFMASPGFAPNQSSTSGTLSSNTIPNLKVEMKAITTRSGVAYEGPSIPTPKKVVEQETEETTNKEQSKFQGSTSRIQPLVTLILEPNVLKTLPKPKLPYPSRLNGQKLHEKATNQMENDAPQRASERLGDPGKFLIPCDFLGMDMTLELANRSITRPKGVAEDVFVKVGKFYFSTDFVVVDFEADPRVPLILGRSFFRTAHALINVYREEITLRVNDEGITFNLNQTTRYSSTYDDLLVNRVDIIDVAREEYAQEILSFSSNSSGGNPTSTFKPILSDSSPSLTSFEGSDFILEEIDAYLKDESVSPKIDHADCDPEGDICLIKKLLNNDPFQLPLMDLKQEEVVKEKSLIEEPLELELKKLPSHLEYAYLEGVDKTFQRSMMAIFHDMIEKTMEVFMDDFLVFGDSFSSCLSHLDTMLQRSGENHIHLPMYGTFAYCRMPFGLCNAPGTFQRCMMEIFHDMIEKTMEVFMDDFFVFENSFQSCLSHLERMLKRCEDTNLCLNWEKSHFMVKEGIVIGHKIFKQWIEVDKAKVYFITKLPHPKTVKGIRSFLGHVGFYRRFIKDFSKISRPMTRLFEKDTHSFSLKSVLRHSKHSKESLLKLLS